MAPPNTKVKSAMKMIGCRVTSSSASGLRVTPIRLRLASAALWRSETGHTVSASLGLGREVEEHLVEGREVQGELGDGDPGLVEAVDRGGERLVAGDAARRPCRGRGRRAARAAISAMMFAVSSRRAGSLGRTVSVWPPTICFRPVGRVVGDDPAVVDHADLVGQRVGLFEVLRGQQDRRAVVDEVAHDAPHVLALGGVQAGRGLVEEDDARAADEARREVEAAAHAAGVGLRGAVAGVGEVEPVEQLLRAPPWRPCA